MGKILFRIGQDFQHRIRFGETATLFQVAYFKGKELGYSDIYFEWPLKVQFNNQFKDKIYFECSDSKLLPIKFIKRENVILENYERIMDFCKPDILYEGSPPLYLGDPNNPQTQQVTYVGIANYTNKYFYDTGERPVINIPKDKVDTPYILFHYREGIWSTYRNPDIRVYFKMIDILKKKYGDKYKFWKIGETQRVLDHKFDYVAPHFSGNIDGFLRIINNSSLFICTSSGPDQFSELLGTPFIEMESEIVGKGDIRMSARTEEWWKQYEGKWGKTLFDWAYPDRRYIIFKNETLDEQKIYEFTDRWL
jgi:hypothetical protein